MPECVATSMMNVDQRHTLNTQELRTIVGRALSKVCKPPQNLGINERCYKLRLLHISP